MGGFGKEREETEAYVYTSIWIGQVRQKPTHLIVAVYCNVCGGGEGCPGKREITGFICVHV